MSGELVRGAAIRFAGTPNEQGTPLIGHVSATPLDPDRMLHAFEQAPGFICIMRGADHIFEFVNATHKSIFHSEAWIGKPARDAFPDIADQGFFELLDQVYATGERYVAKAAAVRFRPSGASHDEVRYLDFVYAPLFDESGVVTGIFCEGFDVTHALKAERALSESHDRFSAAIDAVRGVLWTNDPDGRMVGEQPGWAALTGQSFEEYQGYGWAQVVHPEDAQPTINAWKAAVAAREVFNFQHRLIVRDGTWREFSIRAVPIVGPDGQIREWVGVHTDITEEAAAREALRGETQTLETLNRTGIAIAAELDLEKAVQTVTDAGVALTGAQFGAFFYNVLNKAGESYMLFALSGAERAAFEKFGMPRATAVFRPTFVGEGVIRSADILADHRYGKSSPHFGMPSGHLPVRSYLAVPVISRSGEVIGGLFFGHPEPNKFAQRHETLMLGIAAQAAIAIDNARLFQAVQNANEQLETRVAERTKDLTEAHEALRQAQKMEAVGQLTGGIAHDFNNLLMGISGSLDLLDRGLNRRGVTGLEKYMQGAQSSARRAASLTQRLLAFSRRQTLDPKPTDVNKLIYGMEDLIRRTVGPSIEVEVVGQAGLWTALVDYGQLESALLNLAINARDAMPGGGRLTIETANKWLDDRGARERDLMPGQYLSLCVTDTGTGIPDEIVGNIFDPFFTTKPIGEGTGLGLSMVHGFVRQSGGQVRVYSEMGKGTTMCLYLPRHLGEDETAAEIGDVVVPDSGSGQTVLVIDDEPTVRMLIADVLTEAGYSVLEAQDGPSGMRILASQARIDLLVSDVGLPGGMNGRQVADAARTTRPDLKVLFVTGFAENAAIGNGLLPPGMAVITKPFQVTDFAKKVAEIIEE